MNKLKLNFKKKALESISNDKIAVVKSFLKKSAERKISIKCSAENNKSESDCEGQKQ